MTLRLASFASLWIAGPALAHPGHGAAGWLHGLALEHLAPGLAAAALVALALGVRRLARERWRSH